MLKRPPNTTLLSHPNWKQYFTDSRLLTKLREPNASPQLKREYFYWRGYHDFEFFVTTFFPEHCAYPFSQMHRDFFLEENEPSRRSRRDVVAAPRGHAKTTFKVVFKVIHAIVYGYEPFIVIIGHSAPEAEAKVRDILFELEQNTLLVGIFGSLAPKQGQAGYGTKSFTTLNGIRVISKSRGKQVRGLKHGHQRPTLIILDDIESPEKVLTEEQRYKTKEWFEKDILKLGSVDGQANITIIGTCLHPEALLPQLLESPGWNARKYQAVQSFSDNEGVWEQWKAIYTDLTLPDRVEVAEAFVQKNQTTLLEGTQVLWPEAEPYARLMKTIVDEGRASFQSEKQNDPYDPERQIFDMDNAKRFRSEYHPNGELCGFRCLDGSNRYVDKVARVVAYHDPALAKTSDSDYAAIVVCFIDFDGYIYCLDAYIEKVIPSRQIEQVFRMQKKWHFKDLYLEDNNFQDLLKQSYRDAQERCPELRVHGVTQHHNKQKRISTLEPLISNGQLLFHEGLNARLISQLRLFPTTYDDGPDALHGAVSQLKKQLGSITVTRSGSSLW